MWPALPSFIDTGVTRKTSVMSCAAASLGNGNFQLHYNFRSLYHICGSEYCHVVRGCTRPISLEDVREKSNGVFFPFFFLKMLHLRSEVLRSFLAALGFFTVLPCCIWIKQHCTGLWRRWDCSSRACSVDRACWRDCVLPGSRRAVFTVFGGGLHNSVLVW